MKRWLTNTALILFGAVILCGPAAGEVVERIAAVIGERVILASELATQVQMVMIQAGSDANLDPNELAANMLQEMVNDELILSAAKDDTTITVTDNEIESALTEHLASLIARFPSEEAFLEQLSREGWTKRSYEKRLRLQIGDQVLKEKIINLRLSQVTVSRQEVEAFYEEFADSLPDLSPRVRLAHILVKFKPSPQTDDSLEALAEAARKVATQGLDLASVATQFGGDAIGGRIGYVNRNELVPEFARAAFNLQPESISGPVRTNYGWHIIKCHNRGGDSVDVSQILFPIVVTAADSARTTVVVDSLFQELLAGADFREMAKLHSGDDATRATGGEMEMMTTDNVRPEFLEAITTLDTGQISEPVVSQLGYHIIKLLDKSDGRKIDPEQDYDIIRNIARQRKTADMVSDWVDELKKKTYVDIRDIDLIQ